MLSLGAAWTGVTQVQISQLTDNQAKIQVENTKLQSIINGLVITVEIIVVQTKLYQEYSKQHILDVGNDLSALEIRVNALNEKI